MSRTSYLSKDIFLWIIIVCLVLIVYWQETSVKERSDYYDAAMCQNMLLNMSRGKNVSVIVMPSQASAPKG